MDLTSLISRYGLTLPETRAGYDPRTWRSALSQGRLPCFDCEATLLVTDGIVAWFVLADGTLFFGHLAAFVKNKAPREASARAESRAARERAMRDAI